MTTLAKVRKCVHPRPVYQADFADSTYVRMSFWSPKGKPLAVDRARNLILSLTRWSPAGIVRVARYNFGNPYRGGTGTNVAAPYTPIERGLLSGKRLVRGYVEHDVPGQPWVRFVDPYFTPHAVTETARPKRITARHVKTVLADLVAYLDGEGPDDALRK
ncbi:MAG: hypothetical protein ACR2RE_14635, partial [Geminicoccaceae bacterium]